MDNGRVTDADEKREAIRSRYVSLMTPLFFPDHPAGPDIVRYFASLLRIVGMEDKGWEPICGITGSTR